MESLDLVTAFLLVLLGVSLLAQGPVAAETWDISDAAVLVRSGDRSLAEQTAAEVLVEEVQRRTGLEWVISDAISTGKPTIVLGGGPVTAIDTVPKLADRPEAYRLVADPKAGRIWILGADGRGALYGVGRFLRELEWAPGCARFPKAMDITTVPAYPIRGHQLGYRARANSYDAWNESQYEQYIRELVFFGLNAVENIPFEDSQPSPVMPVPREEMNLRISAICQRYDVDYWVWVPAVFDLGNATLRAAELDSHEAFFAACPRLDGFFFPGGDPGNNPPELVLPFLEDVAKRLETHHPEARIWLSMQGFDPRETTQVYKWIDEHAPDWLGGLVAGPSSPPIPATRKRLPDRYRLRHYPDITHTILCQYETSWWDLAFSRTLGREACNPQPVFYAHIHNWYAPYTDGFITYSDGVHDDINKAIWSARGWDPEADVRGMLIEYARVFFGPQVAERAADGILALERNWEGPAAQNGAIDATLAWWQNLERESPALSTNWRWQLCLLRAHYDAYVRHRIIAEQALEAEANACLAEAPAVGADAAMDAALRVLETPTCRPDLRARIETLCDDLFHSIGLQTSVEKYHASGAERGAVLDFVDYPLNNRWWLEDEFAKIRAMADEKAKCERLEIIRTWENPGPGSFYDDVGNVAKSPHVVRGEALNTDPEMLRNPGQCHWWWNDGLSRARLSWQVSMNWPLAMRYEGLDPEARYVFRMTGCGDAFTRMDGARVEPTLYDKGIGEFKEFPVPPEAIKDGVLEVTWDTPLELDLNWREQSRITEAWLLRKE